MYSVTVLVHAKSCVISAMMNCERVECVSGLDLHDSLICMETRLHEPTKRFKGPNDRHKKLVRGMLKDGKSFKASALEAGYSPTVAKQGLAFMRRHSVGVDAEFIEQSKQMSYTPGELMALSKGRLVSDITRGKSSGCERAIEVLGKFKDLDWFVRNADVQIGIFAGLTDDDSAKTLEATALPDTDKSTT